MNEALIVIKAPLGILITVEWGYPEVRARPPCA
jgi:hypothetical protein